MISLKGNFDTFLSHSHDDAEWVEHLAKRLEDDCGFRVWLDKWVLVPGKSWQQEMKKGLEESLTCAICIGGSSPEGWFLEEIERALDIQTKKQNFRVIPVLLPGAQIDHIPVFLSLRTWADFRDEHKSEYAFHVLRKGILGEPVGRWIEGKKDIIKATEIKFYEKKIQELAHLQGLGLHKEVVIEYQRKILDRWLDKD